MAGEDRSEPTTRGRIHALGALVFAIAVGASLPGLDGVFVFDDWPGLVENPHVRRVWAPWVMPPAPPFTPLDGRPVAAHSFSWNHVLTGDDGRGYRAVNIAIHALVALLVFGIARRTLVRVGAGRAAAGLACVGAAIWAAHPIQTECVGYVTQRTTSLMALFFAGTLYATIRADAERRRAWAAVAIAACALGMGTKESMVTAPIVAAAWLFCFGGVGAIRRNRALLVGLAATWLVLAGVLWPRDGHGDRIASVTAPRAVDANDGDATAPALRYLRNQAQVVPHYLRLIAWPTPLSIDYGRPRDVPWRDAALPGALVLALLAATGWSLLRRSPWGFVGAWFFLTLAPTSSWIPIHTEVAAERRVYLALAGPIAIALGGAWFGWARRSVTAGRLACAVGVAVVVALALASAARYRDYDSRVAIWRSAVAAVPDNVRGHTNLGAALAIAGDTTGAIAALETALRLEPGYWKAEYNLARQLERSGASAEALRHYRALAARDGLGLAETRLAAHAMSEGRKADAQRWLERAVHERPSLTDAHVALARLHALDGRPDDALRHYRLAAAQRPDLAEAREALGNDCLLRGAFDEAIEHFEAALDAAPALVGSLNGLASALLNHDDPGKRDASRALDLATRANARTDGASPPLLYTLAAARLATGDADGAHDAIRRGRDAARRTGAAGLVERFDALAGMIPTGR